MRLHRGTTVRKARQAHRTGRLREHRGIGWGHLSDCASPAICMNEGCDYTAETEPDQDAGFCEECRTNSMQSALILAGLI
jgi:hypothetical protein